MGGSTKSIKSFKSIRKRDVAKERREAPSYSELTPPHSILTVDLFGTARSRSSGPASKSRDGDHNHDRKDERRQHTHPPVYAQDHYIPAAPAVPPLPAVPAVPAVSADVHVPFHRPGGNHVTHGDSRKDFDDDNESPLGNRIISPQELRRGSDSSTQSQLLSAHELRSESLPGQRSFSPEDFRSDRSENLHHSPRDRMYSLQQLQRSLHRDTDRENDQHDASSLFRRDTGASSLFSRGPRSGTPSTSSGQSSYSAYSTLGHAVRGSPAAARTTTLRSTARAAASGSFASGPSSLSAYPVTPSLSSSMSPTTVISTPAASAGLSGLDSDPSSPYTPASGLAPVYDTVKIVAHRPEDVNAVRASLTHLQMVWSLYTSLNRPQNLADAIERQLEIVSRSVDRLSDLPPFTITVPVADGRATPSSSYHSVSPPSELHPNL